MNFDVDILSQSGQWKTYAQFAFMSDAVFYAIEVCKIWPDNLVRVSHKDYTLYYKGGVEVIAPDGAPA